MDTAATHIGPLAAAINKFGRMVLEVGVGWYSTPLIHALCPQSWVLSLETDRAWADALRPIGGDRILLCEDIVSAAARHRLDRPWNVVFLDCYEGEDRVAIAELFLNLPCCIVAHDTERGYWQKLLSGVRYRSDFTFLIPHTSFLSNTLDVTL